MAVVKDFRLDGIYVQRQEGFFMQRVKLPAGMISSRQARTVADGAERFGRGAVHLTSRGSMEIHWLQENDLPALKRLLTAAGLTSRGACGGAVRGITCGSGLDNPAELPRIEAFSRRLQRHFTGNPRFERLPKKFKIGIESSTAGKRHLIQDAGLVLAGRNENGDQYDLYLAGGLGREPRAGFLFEKGLPEERVIPTIEAVLKVYAANTPPGKRLKHLVASIGHEELRRLVAAQPTAAESLPPVSGFPEALLSTSTDATAIQARIFAGQLTSSQVRILADFADTWSDGVLVATADQNIAFLLPAGTDRNAAAQALAAAGFGGNAPEDHVRIRVCPGTHECRAGLAPTREVAREIVSALGAKGKELTIALSGCQNSCTQPQLAEIGIVTSGLVKGEDGERTPRFDIWQPAGEGLGEVREQSLARTELCSRIRELS